MQALFCGARFLLYPESHYVYRQRPASANRREVTRITRQALLSSQRLRAAVPAAGSAELAAALDEYEQRWLLLFWFAQFKRGVADRRFRQALELLMELPASPSRVFRFACDRARIKWDAP